MIWFWQNVGIWWWKFNWFFILGLLFFVSN